MVMSLISKSATVFVSVIVKVNVKAVEPAVDDTCPLVAADPSEAVIVTYGATVSELTTTATP